MIVISYGTRPEIIKIFPIIHELNNRNIPHIKIFTGQHPDLVKDITYLIGGHDLSIDIDRNRSLNDLLATIIKKISPLITNSKCVIVQGDTTSALGVALAAFNLNIPVCHIEAGLRTNDLDSPFPEEGNRQIISRITKYNFAPTSIAVDNLLKEGIEKDKIFLTGNTIIDACKSFGNEIEYSNKVIITLHRRENFKIIEELLLDINDIALNNKDIEFVYISHPNPNVKSKLGILKSKNINIIEPMSYEDMIELISKAKFIISDSGGLQEESTAFSKRILIVRDNTERPEVVTSGFGIIGLPNLKYNFDIINNDYKINKDSPFGDGRASKNIVDILEKIK